MASGQFGRNFCGKIDRPHLRTQSVAGEAFHLHGLEQAGQPAPLCRLNVAGEAEISAQGRSGGEGATVEPVIFGGQLKPFLADAIGEPDAL